MANLSTTANTSPANHVLLVEGKDDESVMYSLRQTYTQLPAFEIRRKDGIDQLLKGIRWEIEIEDYKAVGIIADADDNLTSRWQSVAYKLKEAHIIPPIKPNPSGTIIPSRTIVIGDRPVDRPRVGVWLMPDNKSPGELEDFIASLIPAGDQVWPLSDAYIDSIPHAHRKFSQKKTQRAKVHAWLATRRSPRPLGTAITARDLNIESSEGQLFIDWLRRLFR